jgi:phosphomannomutase
MIKFGTDGWRAVISDDFTFANVRIVAQAYANYLKRTGFAKNGVFVGYDNRFQSENFALEAAKVLAYNGIDTNLSINSVPSQVTSFAVNLHGYAGGVMITASHNPPTWNGFKIKAKECCSASKEITAQVEEEANKISSVNVPPDVEKKIKRIDLKEDYLRHISSFIDLKKIKEAGLNIVIDPMHGSGAGYVKELLERNGIDCIEINGNRDPLFGGVNPEPIPLNLGDLSKFVENKSKENPGIWVGLATDGDADRIGGCDGKGKFLTSHDMFVLILKHLYENKHLKGSVIKTFNITNLIGILCKKYGLQLRETPIGFKYIADYMLKEDVLVGGEESGGIGVKGHIPERDGILNTLLLLECMAYYKKDLRAVLNSVMDEFGYYYYDRIDVHLSPATDKKIRESLKTYAPASFNGEKVTDIQKLDGIKLFVQDSSWILFRLSGTEPLLRIYCEATSPEKVQKMLSEGKKLLAN